MSAIIQSIQEVNASIEDFRQAFDDIEAESDDFETAIKQLLARHKPNLSDESLSVAAREMVSGYELWEKRAARNIVARKVGQSKED